MIYVLQIREEEKICVEKINGHFVCIGAEDGFSPNTALADMGQFAGYFLLPSTILFAIFFLTAIGVQLNAFVKGKTPYPKWCWIFTLLFGVAVIIVCKLIGDYPLTNALATGWISLGNIWMTGGLLVMMPKVQKMQLEIKSK